MNDFDLLLMRFLLASLGCFAAGFSVWALSAREIHEAVEEELGWSFSSTRKTVERMMEKQMVAQHMRHGVQVYDALLDKVETLAAYARDFGTRIMELDTPLPVNMFAGSKLVDASELAQLEQMLSDWPDEDDAK